MFFNINVMAGEYCTYFCVLMGAEKFPFFKTGIQDCTLKIPEMKQRILFIGLVLIVGFSSCSKKSATPDNSTGPFKFISLAASDTVLKVDAATSLIATATGEGLTYTWTCDFGTFIPNPDGINSTIGWTVCHADNFTIHCTVTDKNNNSETKDIIIRTHV
jgi:hypothetical protein